MLLSVVVPILNEIHSLPRLKQELEALQSFLMEQGHEIELILNDNASADGSSKYLAEWASESKNVKHVRFGRRVTFQQSIIKGFRSASGDCLAVLQGDLQDPPEIVKDFFQLWLKGNKIVVGLDRNRHTGYFQNFARKAFYRVMKASHGNTAVVGFQDFYLLDRSVYSELGRGRNNFKFIRGTLASSFSIDQVVLYERRFREFGASKFRVSEKYDLALDALLAYSGAFTRLMSIGGLLVSTLASVIVLSSLALAVFGYDFGVPGWLSLFSAILLVVGLLTFVSALQFEYLRRLLVLLTDDEE